MMHQFLSTESCYHKAKQKDIWHESCLLFLVDKAARSPIRYDQKEKFIFGSVLAQESFISENGEASQASHGFNLQHLSLTCFLSRDTHLESMEPRVRLGIMWFKTFARKTCKQPKHIQALLFIFVHQRVPEDNFSLLFFSLLPPSAKCDEEDVMVLHRFNHLTASPVCSCSVRVKKHIQSY